MLLRFFDQKNKWLVIAQILIYRCPFCSMCLLLVLLFLSGFSKCPYFLTCFPFLLVRAHVHVKVTFVLLVSVEAQQFQLFGKKKPLLADIALIWLKFIIKYINNESYFYLILSSRKSNGLNECKINFSFLECLPSLCLSKTHNKLLQVKAMSPCLET